MADQQPGCYPRVNGGMIQTNQYTETVVSLVGKLISPNTMQTADGTNIVLLTDSLADGLVVNPDMSIEIIGSVQDATTVLAFVARDLSTDMDLSLYNQMISIQSTPSFSYLFVGAASN